MITINNTKLEEEVNNIMTRANRVKALNDKVTEILPISLAIIEKILNKKKIQIGESTAYYTATDDRMEYVKGRISIRVTISFKEKYCEYDSVKVGNLQNALKDAGLLHAYASNRDVALMFEASEYNI